MGAGAMRLIVQPLAGRFELCARLGLVFVGWAGGGKIIHAVLEDSPSARAGLEPRDIVIAVNETQLDAVRFLTFSDRRPSELNLKVFVARYFTIACVMLRVPPEPYRPIEAIVAEATRVIAARPTPLKPHYVNPRFDEMRELLSMLRRRRRR
jgi:membrane-associated protease RseP (regulator of RpoE activity)